MKTGTFSFRSSRINKFGNKYLQFPFYSTSASTEKYRLLPGKPSYENGKLSARYREHFRKTLRQTNLTIHEQTQTNSIDMA